MPYNLKVKGLDGVKIIDVEFNPTVDRWRDVGDRAAKALGYHGTFSFRMPDGAMMDKDQNLEDSEGLSYLDEDSVVEIVEVGA